MIRAAIGAITPLVMAGCSGALSTLDPAGPHARSVATLWWVMLAGATVLAGLVFVLLAFAFRRRGERAPARSRLWIGWLGLAMPAAVLSALLIYALLVGVGTLPVTTAEVVEVRVEARQYAWEVVHPDGIRTTDTIHIPAGRPVDLVLTARDVIHSLWIPRLAGKLDAIPGHTNRLRIEAEAPGTYRGVCAEYCGIGHAGHDLVVIAHDPAGWAAFLAGGRR